MEYVDCPECSCKARRMPILSDVNQTDNFYHCESCGVVSHMPKDLSAPPAPLVAGPAARAGQGDGWNAMNAFDADAVAH